ncbi:MAG: carboxypeptidase-like regulatory domain-containing protein [Flavobacteriales bacterium]
MLIDLSRIRRCDQVWDDMPVVEGGRLCRQCSRTIVDFTAMSDEAIARTHAFSESFVCGVYREDQLRSLRPSTARRNTGPHPAAFSLLSLLLLEPNASLKAQEVPMEQTEPDRDAVVPVDVSDTTAEQRERVIVRGRVLEQLDKGYEAVPFALISVRGTERMTQSDFEGNFSLDLTDVADTTATVELDVTFVGFARQTRTIDLTALKEEEFVLSGGEVIAFGVTMRKPPLHKRIWWGMTRPFRR